MTSPDPCNCQDQRTAEGKLEEALEKLSGARHTSDMHAAEARRLRTALAELQEEHEHQGRRLERLRRELDDARNLAVRCRDGEARLEDEAEQLQRQLNQVWDERGRAIESERWWAAEAAALGELAENRLRNRQRISDENDRLRRELARLRRQPDLAGKRCWEAQRECERMREVVEAARKKLLWMMDTATGTTCNWSDVQQVYDLLALDALTRPGSADSADQMPSADPAPDQRDCRECANPCQATTSPGCAETCDEFTPSDPAPDQPQTQAEWYREHVTTAFEQPDSPSSPSTNNQEAEASSVENETQPGGGEGEIHHPCNTCRHENKDPSEEPCASCIELDGDPDSDDGTDLWEPCTPPSPVPGVTVHESLPRRAPKAVITRHETELAELEGQLAASIQRAEKAEARASHWHTVLNDTIGSASKLPGSPDLADCAREVVERLEKAERRVEEMRERCLNFVRNWEHTAAMSSNPTAAQVRRDHARQIREALHHA